jgi:hypothetical protein
VQWKQATEPEHCWRKYVGEQLGPPAGLLDERDDLRDQQEDDWRDQHRNCLGQPPPDGLCSVEKTGTQNHRTDKDRSEFSCGHAPHYTAKPATIDGLAIPVSIYGAASGKVPVNSLLRGLSGTLGYR